MTKLCTSLRFADVPAVAELLARLGSTGRLRVNHGAWSGEILVRRGQIIGASLDAECGRAALESISIGLLDGELNFVDEALAEDGEPLLDPADSAKVLKQLSRERRQIVNLIPSLQAVPRLVETTDGPTDKTVTLVAVGAAALEIIPELAFGRTLEEIARERGLARTVRDIATLVAGNAVKLEVPAGSEILAQNATEPAALVPPGGLAIASTARLPAPAPSAGHKASAWPRPSRVMVGRLAPRPAPGSIGSAPPTGRPPGRVMPTQPAASWSRPTPAWPRPTPAPSPTALEPVFVPRLAQVEQSVQTVAVTDPAVRPGPTGWRDAIRRFLGAGPRADLSADPASSEQFAPAT